MKSSLEQSITVNNLLRDNHHGVVLFKINFHFFLTATSLPPESFRLNVSFLYRSIVYNVHCIADGSFIVDL